MNIWKLSEVLRSGDFFTGGRFFLSRPRGMAAKPRCCRLALLLLPEAEAARSRVLVGSGSGTRYADDRDSRLTGEVGRKVGGSDEAERI